MQTRFKLPINILVFGLLVTACAGPQDRASAGQSAADGAATAPKRLTVAIMGNPPHANSRITVQSSVAGMHEIDQVVHAGLTNIDNLGTRIPQLAEQVPTTENGLWRVLADGRMETTWKIRPNVTWHDGTPFTTADLLFTTTLGRDPDLGGNDALYRRVESAEAVDPLTFKVVWRETFILADTMFTREISRPYHQPVPRHLVESTYATDRMRIPELSYWSDDFVGLGPFKLRDFVRASHFLFDAFDHSIVDPSDPDFQDAERRVVKYEYDPAKAIAMISELGFTRGSDGMFRNNANEPLSIEIRSSRGDNG